MFCKTCGKEVNEKAVVCVGCGCNLDERKKSSVAMVVLSYLLAFFAPLFGLIAGIWLACHHRHGNGAGVIVASVIWGFIVLAMVAGGAL